MKVLRVPPYNVHCSIHLAICFFAYFGVSTVVTMMVPYTELDVNAAVADVFKQRNVKVMGTLIAVGATAGLLGKACHYSFCYS